MQAPALIQRPYAGASNLVPFLSVFYFEWAHVDIPNTLRYLMWGLLLACSVPMLAYQEAMAVGMKKYEPGLVSWITQPRAELLDAVKSLGALLNLLPRGRFMAFAWVGNYFLYLIVLWEAVASGQYFVLGAQLVLILYSAWAVVFLRIHAIEAGAKPPT